MNYSTLPEKLRSTGRFCNWRYEEVKGRRTKVPYNPLTGKRAQSNNPNTFGSFEEACAALRQNRGYNGIGVGIFGDLAAIDIDHCIENGEYSPMAEEIIERMDAYTETSPSGTGVRILFFAKNFQYDANRYYINNQKLGLEVYVAGATQKFVTVTGNAPQLYQLELEERGAELRGVLERFMVRRTLPQSADADSPLREGAKGERGSSCLPPSLRGDVPQGQGGVNGGIRSDQELLAKARTAQNGVLERFMVRRTLPQSADADSPLREGAKGERGSSCLPPSLRGDVPQGQGGVNGGIRSDQELLAKARQSQSGDAFQRLYSGDITGYPSQSEADMALCSQLAFWTGCDLEQMDRLFRQSGLMRRKWERPQSGSTYGQMTLRKAIEACRDVYTPKAGRSAFSEPYSMEGLIPPPEGYPPLDGLIPPEHTSPVSAPAPETLPGKPKPTPRFKPISARELQAMDLPETNWVVDELLPEGLVLLASPPKFGKSWMVLDIALCVAAKESFWGRPTAGKRCLYLALEDSHKRLKSRMNRILAGKSAPENLDYQIKANTLDNGLLNELKEYMDVHPDTGLIIIDTLQKVRGQALKGESSYQTDYRELGRLKALADYYHICVICVHHLRKMSDEGDPFNRISGTNGILGAADMAWVLTRGSREEDQTLLSVTGRDVASEEAMLCFNKTSCRWERVGDAREIRLQEAREQYEHDPLVMAVQKLAKEPQGWEGNASELMEECVKRVGVYPAVSPRSYVPALKRLSADLRRYDGIYFDASRKNRNGIIIRIWKGTVDISSGFDRFSKSGYPFK